MIAAIYCRVSLEEQIDNFSLSAQLNEIQQYCVKNNIQIYQVYKDEGLSGTKEDRPEFQRMIKDAEKHLFNIILVHKFDRFARRIELSHKIKSRLKKASVNVISISEPIEDSPIGFFQEGLLELLAEYYVRNLAKEVKKGQAERVKQGLPSGTVPFGYYTKEKNVYIDEKEAEVVKQIFQLYINGTGYLKICHILESASIPNPKGIIKWRESHIARILSHTLYTGNIYYNGQLYPSQVPQIISQEQFDMVQRMRGNKSAGRIYNSDTKHLFLFAGYLICGECLHVMQIHSRDKALKYYYYFCNTAKRNRDCTHKQYYKTNLLEESIIDNIRLIAKSKQMYIDVPESSNISDIIDNRRESIDKELKRAKEAYLSGIFELSEYAEIKKKLESELIHIKPIEPQKINIAKQAKTLLEFLELESEVIQKRKIITKFIDNITIVKSSLHINWRNLL